MCGAGSSPPLPPSSWVYFGAILGRRVPVSRVAGLVRRGRDTGPAVRARRAPEPKRPTKSSTRDGVGSAVAVVTVPVWSSNGVSARSEPPAYEMLGSLSLVGSARVDGDGANHSGSGSGGGRSGAEGGGGS
eukprot:scaffold22741_cov111-Isochrysis_galbana.AAC.6